MRNFPRTRLDIWIALFLLHSANAAPTKVGNGDPGNDLENLGFLTSGPIVDARTRAFERLRSINVAGIPGLGDLIPEVEHTEIYLAKADVSATLPEDHGSFHSSMAGKVYARTFARPHASTRFFPEATQLSADQLVALHIHEGLHRALPRSIREDEAAVSKLTLAIVAPGSSHDQLKEAVGALIPASQVPEAKDRTASSQALTEAPTEHLTEVKEHFTNPSSLRVSAQNFLKDEGLSLFPVDRIFTLSSDLYPWGGRNVPLGLGIEFSLIQGKNRSTLGPLGISARIKAWTVREFDILFFGGVALNTLSPEELKSSPMGRDVFYAGIAMQKDRGLVYVKNALTFTAKSEARQKLADIEYQHKFGWITDVAVHSGINLWKFKLGGYGQIYLADNYQVSGGAFAYESGRFRILAIGPEFSFVNDFFTITAWARTIVNSTQDANFDYLGNILGAGVAQGSLGLALNVLF